jgi:hypothetical protein
MSRSPLSRPSARWWLILLSLGFAVMPAQAENLKLEAKLVWGTDEPSKDPKHKPVDAATAKKLQRCLKWKHYYVINRQVKPVMSRSSTRFELSKECTIEISELEGPRVEVRLVGKGKEVHKTTEQLSEGGSFVYVGDDKNNCAWAVIISQLAEK